MDDYYVSPEQRAEELQDIRVNLGSRFPPGDILEWADVYDVIPELLELEEAAYLIPYHNLLTEIKRLALIDDKDQFASLLITNHVLVKDYPPEAILQLLCKRSAVACTNILLESQIEVDIDSEFETGLPPMHIAALNLNYGMTKLLLDHGADADVHSNGCNTPLHTALNAFVKLEVIDSWSADSAEKFILKLFYFSCLPELKEPLDTISLLASHSKILEDLCFRAMDVGYVQKYAPLLMVAWDKLMVSSAEGDLYTTPVWQRISRVLSSESLQQEICERSMNSPPKDELVENLEMALSVVKTMWVTIGVLERNCHSRVESVPMCELPFHIPYDLVKDAGLDLKLDVANIQRLSKLTAEAKVLLERKHYVEPQQSGSILRSFNGKLVTGTAGSLSSSLVPRFQFHTRHNLNPMENHLCKTPQVKPSSHNVLAWAKSCAPLMRFAKRSIK